MTLEQNAVTSISRRDDADFVSALQTSQSRLVRRKAYEALYRRYQSVDSLRPFPPDLPLDLDEWENLLQEFWYKLWDNPDRLRNFDHSKRSFAPYLKQAIRNAAVDYLKRRKPARSLVDVSDIVDPKRPPPTLPPEFEKLIADNLTDEAQHLLRLRFIEDDRPAREIAELIGKDVKYVSKKLYRVKQKLKALIKEKVHREELDVPPEFLRRIKSDDTTELCKIIKDQENIFKIVGDFPGQYSVGVGLPPGEVWPQIIVHIEGENANGVARRVTVAGETYPITVECGFETPQLH